MMSNKNKTKAHTPLQVMVMIAISLPLKRTMNGINAFMYCNISVS